MSRTFPSRDGVLRGVGRALRGLIRAWWTVDRVRISPREGALLRLQPPCVIFILGEPFQILRRTADERLATEDHSAPIGIRYDCHSPSGCGCLQVQSDCGRGFPRVIWQTETEDLVLAEHQLEIYG